MNPAIETALGDCNRLMAAFHQPNTVFRPQDLREYLQALQRAVEALALEVENLKNP
jgi:hypothetical protein